MKKEIVLTAAWGLALISMAFIPPSLDYIAYIDLRSLGILWALMIIMAGLRDKGVFDRTGSAVLRLAGRVWQLTAILVLLCFFSSMFITNDVALLTFVPFAVFTLEECGRTDLLIPVVVLQTMAANLGSMLTPVGNPQNLYLYGVSGMQLLDFIRLMLPYTALTFLLLVLSIALLKGRGGKLEDIHPEEVPVRAMPMVICYGMLFLLSLLTVSRIVPWTILAAAVLVSVFVFDRGILAHADYALLMTFVGFFIFSGNMGRIPVIRDALIGLVDGREVLSGILASQVISNVPAALLLCPFAGNMQGLIVGVNLGGLGTLIASMASLISFKLLGVQHPELKGRYFKWFTITGLLYLLILIGLCLFLGKL